MHGRQRVAVSICSMIDSKRLRMARRVHHGYAGLDALGGRITVSHWEPFMSLPMSLLVTASP